MPWDVTERRILRLTMSARHASPGKRGLLACALLLAACSEPITPRIWEPGAVYEETGAFPVGEIASFSGSEGAAALEFHLGLQAAIDERNAAGGVRGRPMELVVLDDRGRPEEARLAAQRMAQQMGVVAIACSSGAACHHAAREGSGPVGIVLPRSVVPAAQRGREAAARLIAALERAKKILPKEVAEALATRAGS